MSGLMRKMEAASSYQASRAVRVSLHDLGANHMLHMEQMKGLSKAAGVSRWAS